MDLHQAVEHLCTGGSDAQQAMKIVFKAYQLRFERFLNRKYGLSRQDGEEVTQDTWIKVFKHLEKTRRVPEHLDALLFTILNNTAVDLIRKKRRQPIQVALQDVPADHHDNGVGDVELTECMMKAFRALESQYPNDAELLRRLALSDGDLKNMSRELDVSYPALRQRLYKARSRLMEHLGRFGVRL